MRASVSLEPDRRPVRAVCSTAIGAPESSSQSALLAELPYPDALAQHGTPSCGDGSLLRRDGCLQGRRRLELFGEDHNIRPGWVTVGSSLVGSNFNAQVTCPKLTTQATASHLKFSKSGVGRIAAAQAEAKAWPSYQAGTITACVCHAYGRRCMHVQARRCSWRVRPLTA